MTTAKWICAEPDFQDKKINDTIIILDTSSFHSHQTTQYYAVCEIRISELWIPLKSDAMCLSAVRREGSVFYFSVRYP